MEDEKILHGLGIILIIKENNGNHYILLFNFDQ
jgi:hypothetical protein